MKKRFSAVVALIIGLTLTTAMAGGKYSGGSGSGYAAAASAPVRLGDSAPSLALEGDQIIERTWQQVPSATITISDTAPATITTEHNLRLTISGELPLIWDSTVTTPLLGGTGASSVAASVTYEDGAKTLVISVTDNFADNATLTLSGLAFTNAIYAAMPQRLTLDIDNDKQPDAFSSHFIGVTVLRPGGPGAGDTSCKMAVAQRLYIPGGTLFLVR